MRGDRLTTECSIVIPVYNHASITRQCLNALLARPPDTVKVEIVVVDDGSSDITPRLLAGYGDQIRVVTHEVNAGFASACNDGAAVASGECLVFLNNDIIPKGGWLDALVRYAQSHPRAAVVGSKLLYPDNTIQHAGVVVCQDLYTRHIYSGFPADHPAVNKSRRFQAVTGASMLVRRDAFEQVGGFDAGFVNAYEDHDLCLRLGERDYEVHYCHESVLFHLESMSRAGRTAEFERATRRYHLRWANRIQPDDLAFYLEDGLMRLTYREYYPISLTISPLLALLDADDRACRADRLLEARAKQVHELLNDNVRLRERLEEITLPPHVEGTGHETRSSLLQDWTNRE
jgi:GT2 family glycosyltransferase